MFKQLHLTFTGQVEAVTAVSALPAEGIVAGAIRYVVADDTLYTYDGVTWSQANSGGTGNFDVLTANTLIVNNFTYLNSNVVEIGDNIIVLNAQVTGNPTEDAGIAIERGTQPDAQLIWDETNGTWTSGVVGSMTPLPSVTPFEGDGAYFLTSDASDLGAGRYEMRRGVPPGGGFGVTAAGLVNGASIAEFATVAGYPNATYLPSGFATFYLSARQTAGTQTARIFVQYKSRSLLGFDTIHATSSLSSALTGSNTLKFGYVEIPVISGLDATDRLMINIRVEVTGAGTAPDVTVDIQGVNFSRCRFPYEPARVEDAIVDGVVSAAPSQNAVFDALAGKQDVLSGPASRFAVYDSFGALSNYNPMSINATNGVDLNQPVAPAATGNYIKHNNAYFPVSASVDSNEHWYADWREPVIVDTGFNMGDPLTGNGGLNGLGMAMTAFGDFGYMRNFDFSIQVGNGVDAVAGYQSAAINQYINVSANATVEQIRGLPISIGGQAGSSIADVFGTSLNVNIAECTNSITGWQLGGNAAFTGVNTQYTGLDVSGAVTGVVNATGLNIYMGGVTASGLKRAINAVGDVFIDGDLELTGAFAFSGDLSVGSIQSFKAIAVTDGGGNPASNNGIVSQFTGTGTVANCDTIGLTTPAIINLDATFVGTSGGFGLGLASTALPNLITMSAGCSLDNLTAAAYVNLFDATNTGGTIDRVIGCRALNIAQGGTQTITRAYNFFADYFAGDVAVDSWGFYDSGAKYNWMANALKIGTGDTTAYNFEVTGDSKFDGDVGFYGTNPIAQPASSGAATAGVLYTATEQAMLQEVYDALRALGLMT